MFFPYPVMAEFICGDILEYFFVFDRFGRGRQPRVDMMFGDLVFLKYKQPFGQIDGVFHYNLCDFRLTARLPAGDFRTDDDRQLSDFSGVIRRILMRTARRIVRLLQAPCGEKFDGFGYGKILAASDRSDTIGGKIGFGSSAHSAADHDVAIVQKSNERFVAMRSLVIPLFTAIGLSLTMMSGGVGAMADFERLFFGDLENIKPRAAAEMFGYGYAVIGGNRYSHRSSLSAAVCRRLPRRRQTPLWGPPKPR
jgi:hypothetical protein